MRFGKKAGTITTGPAGGTGEWPKSLRAGETRVRFVDEIENWQEYWEHYDETVKFFPCTGDRQTCPGCTSGIERTAKASKKYLAPVLDPNTGKIWGLKMGQDLANRLQLRHDRNGGTITNRDYTLIRSGQGLDTEYDVEQEEKVAIDLAAYADVLDLEAMLGEQFASAWPDFDPDNPPAANGRAKTEAPARKRAARKRVTEDAEDDKPVTRELADKAKTMPGRTADGGFTDDPPSEAPAVESVQEPIPTEAPEPSAPQAEEPAVSASEDEADDGETVEITEDDLKAMSRSDLIKLARQAELEVTLTMSREAIIEKFLKEFAV